MQLINIYAHSGNAKNLERDELFERDLMFYLRYNIANSYVAGDWNCIINNRDVSNPGSIQVSKVLLKVMRDARFCDAWHIHNRIIKCTYVRTNYGSRIDRVYCSNRDSIKGSEVIHASFSDHSSIVVNIVLDSKVKLSKYYWNLNVNLMQDEEVCENFKTYWSEIKSKIDEFENINCWWEFYAKRKENLSL